MGYGRIGGVTVATQPLSYYRKILVDELKLCTTHEWEVAVATATGNKANTVLQVLSETKTPLAGGPCPILTQFQLQRINQSDSGQSLLLKGGDYVLVDQRGTGGQGTVFRARQRIAGSGERVVALKIVTLPDSTSSEFVRFQNECMFLCDQSKRTASCSEYVVNGLGCFDQGAQSVLVMEWLDGHTLHEVVEMRHKRVGRLPLRQVLRLIKSVISGLQFLHNNGCVHRDIKPKNLVLVEKPNDKYFVCIVDLGLVKLQTKPVTTPGQLMGTYYFTAPECFRDAAQTDVRADIFSIAATLFFLLTGEPPGFELFARYDPRPGSKEFQDFEIWRSTTNSWKRTRLSEIRPEIPQALSDLVWQSLSSNADDRPADVADFASVFDPVLEATQKARDLQKSFPSLRQSLFQVVSQAVKDLLVHTPLMNSKQFTSDARKSLQKHSFPNGMELPECLPSSKAFQTRLEILDLELQNVLLRFDLHQVTFTSLVDSGMQTLVDDLYRFQRLLPKFLALQHELDHALDGIV